MINPLINAYSIRRPGSRSSSYQLSQYLSSATSLISPILRRIGHPIADGILNTFNLLGPIVRVCSVTTFFCIRLYSSRLSARSQLLYALHPDDRYLCLTFWPFVLTPISVRTIFLREHKRLCDFVVEQHSDWGDERIYKTDSLIILEWQCTLAAWRWFSIIPHDVRWLCISPE